MNSCQRFISIGHRIWCGLSLCLCILAANSFSFLPAQAVSLPAGATVVVDGGGQAALRQALRRAQPGDTIIVKAGNYDDGNPLLPLKITVSGTAQAPITLRGENRPQIGNIKFEGANYVILRGFEIAYQSSPEYFTGIKVQSSSFITISHMLIHHLTANGVSVGARSRNIVVENSKIYDLLPRQNYMDAYCLSNASSQNITMRNNECYGFIGDGFQAWTAVDGALYNRGITLIEGNKIYNTRGACSENAIDIKAESGTVIIRHNIMYGFRAMNPTQCPLRATGCRACPAIVLHRDGPGQVLIEGNHIFDSDAAINNVAMQATVQNNLFYNITYFVAFDRGPNSRYFHNSFINTGWVLVESSNNPRELVNNLFFNTRGTARGDYHHNGWFGRNLRRPGPGDVIGHYPRLYPGYTPKSDSPLIDQGIRLNVMFDGNGAPRSAGLAPDIGAFEYTGVVTSQVLIGQDSLGGLDEETINVTIEPEAAWGDATDQGMAEPIFQVYLPLMLHR
jgi:hypothetical protein